ncbi:hypothetical protein GYB22_04610 [bacterium]|nr:hypothetical protein [bacterium]
MKLTLFIPVFLLCTVACSTSNKVQTKNEIEKSEEKSMLASGWYRIVDSTGIKMRERGTYRTFYIDSVPAISMKHLTKVEIFEDDFGGMGLTIHFNSEGAKLWSTLTKELVGKEIAFVVDGVLHQAPMVMAQVRGTKTNMVGSYTREELEEIKQKMEEEME